MSTFLSAFFAGPLRLIEFDSLVATPLYTLFQPHEHTCPDGLRTGIAAPDTTRKGSYRKQCEGSDDQQESEQRKILWPEGQPEDMKLSRGQVEQNQLPAIPV